MCRGCVSVSVPRRTQLTRALPQSEVATLSARNTSLQHQLDAAQEELARVKREVAKLSSAANDATTATATRRAATTTKKLRKRSRPRNRSAGSRHSHGSAGDAESVPGADANGDDIWEGADAQSAAELGVAAGTDAKAGGPAKGAATKGAARRTSTTRRSVKGRPRRLHPSAGSRARHSLGGRLVGLRRPRTAPAKEPTPSAAAATAAAAPAAATAAAQASADATNSDDEFSGEAWRSGADALSKPLPQMNVFSRLSDYRSFTGTHRATHATIALGRNEYHNADNSACFSNPMLVRGHCVLTCASVCMCVLLCLSRADMFRRAKPKAKKAWSSSLRSADDGTAAPAAAAGAPTHRRRRSEAGSCAHPHLAPPLSPLCCPHPACLPPAALTRCRNSRREAGRVWAPGRREELHRHAQAQARGADEEGRADRQAAEAPSHRQRRPGVCPRRHL